MKIYIEVSGGLVQSVYSDSTEPVEIVVADYDNEKNSDDLDAIEVCADFEKAYNSGALHCVR